MAPRQSEHRRMARRHTRYKSSHSAAHANLFARFHLPSRVSFEVSFHFDFHVHVRSPRCRPRRHTLHTDGRPPSAQRRFDERARLGAALFPAGWATPEECFLPVSTPAAAPRPAVSAEDQILEIRYGIASTQGPRKRWRTSPTLCLRGLAASSTAVSSTGTMDRTRRSTSKSTFYDTIYQAFKEDAQNSACAVESLDEEGLCCPIGPHLDHDELVPIRQTRSCWNG